jgi:hypothetical protein
VADALAGGDKLVFSDGSVQPQPLQQIASVAPGFAHSAIVCGPGESTLLPYNSARVFASIQNPLSSGKTVLLSLGEVFASATVYTAELAAGDYFEVPEEVVTTAVHVWNPNVANVTLEVNEGDVSP